MLTIRAAFAMMLVQLIGWNMPTRADEIAEFVERVEKSPLKLSRGKIAERIIRDEQGNVIKLRLSRMKLTEADFSALAKMHLLQNIALAQTNANDDVVKQLRLLPQLAGLSLSGTDITDKSIDWLMKYPQLKILCLGDVNVTPEAVARLKQHYKTNGRRLSLGYYRRKPKAFSWGHIRGQILAKDKINEGLPRGLAVDPESGGLANVAVYLIPEPGQPTPVHPDYDITAGDTVGLTVSDQGIEPHLLLMRTSQTLRKVTSDRRAHQIQIQFFQNPAFGPLIMTGDILEERRHREEHLPVPVRCLIDKRLSGYLLLRELPYMAKTGREGRFEIRNVPAGQHRFRFWHERAGYLRNLPFGEQTSDRRGTLKIDVKPNKYVTAPTAVLGPEHFFADRPIRIKQ